MFSQTNTGRTRKTKNYVFFKKKFLKKNLTKKFSEKKEKKGNFFLRKTEKKKVELSRVPRRMQNARGGVFLFRLRGIAAFFIFWKIPRCCGF